VSRKGLCEHSRFPGAVRQRAALQVEGFSNFNRPGCPRPFLTVRSRVADSGAHCAQCRHTSRLLAGGLTLHAPVAVPINDVVSPPWGPVLMPWSSTLHTPGVKASVQVSQLAGMVRNASLYAHAHCAAFAEREQTISSKAMNARESRSGAALTGRMLRACQRVHPCSHGGPS
jgi:hypothetical protein